MTIDTSVSPTYEWTFRRVVGATLLFALVVFCFWLVYRFYEVVFTLFIAIVFGTLMRPITDRLNRLGIPRLASVLLLYLVILLLLAGFLWLVFPLLATQGAALADQVPGFYQGFREWMASSPNTLLVSLGQSLPARLPFVTPLPASEEQVVDSAAQIWSYVATFARALFVAIVIPVLALYWTLDGPRIIKSIVLLLPQDHRESTSELIATMESKIGLYLVGQLILSLTIGLLSLFAYLLIGLPNALVLALVAGVMEAVPMVGPILGAIPAALVGMSLGADKFVWVAIASVVIQQLENAILVPRVMSRTVGVNPFVTLLALFAFGTLFGVAGALMAIPLAVIMQLILDHLVFKQSDVKMEAAEGRDYTSRIRYETQDLVQDLRKQVRERKHGSEQKIQQTEYIIDEIETLAAGLDEVLAHTNGGDEQ